MIICSDKETKLISGGNGHSNWEGGCFSAAGRSAVRGALAGGIAGGITGVSLADRLVLQLVRLPAISGEPLEEQRWKGYDLMLTALLVMVIVMVAVVAEILWE